MHRVRAQRPRRVRRARHRALATACMGRTAAGDHPRIVRVSAAAERSGCSEPITLTLPVVRAAEAISEVARGRDPREILRALERDGILVLDGEDVRAVRNGRATMRRPLHPLWYRSAPRNAVTATLTGRATSGCSCSAPTPGRSPCCHRSPTRHTSTRSSMSSQRRPPSSPRRSSSCWLHLTPRRRRRLRIVQWPPASGCRRSRAIIRSSTRIGTRTRSRTQLRGRSSEWPDAPPAALLAPAATIEVLVREGSAPVQRHVFAFDDRAAVEWTLRGSRLLWREHDAHSLAHRVDRLVQAPEATDDRWCVLRAVAQVDGRARVFEYVSDAARISASERDELPPATASKDVRRNIRAAWNVPAGAGR